MKNRFVRVLVVTIIASLIYINFFIDEVVDKSKIESNKIKEVETLNIESDTIFNERGYIVIGKPNVVKLIKATDISNSSYEGFYQLIQYKEDILISKEIDSGFVEVYKKYDTKQAFETYKVPLYKGKLADPDFKSNPEAKNFITRIKEGCKQGINFAGHYTLIYWGCGSACQHGVVVDRKTGKIYDGYQTSLGALYKSTSKLILKNSGLMNEQTNYVLINQSVTFKTELWENNKFVSVN